MDILDDDFDFKIVKAGRVPLNRIQLIMPKEGLPFVIAAVSMGYYCGYVGVPPVHRHWGSNYDDVDVYAHGGLTYGENCRPEFDEAAGVAGYHWFGFDCAHAWDAFSPDLMSASYKRLTADLPSWLRNSRYTTFRDLPFVTRECFDLADQLLDLEYYSLKDFRGPGLSFWTALEHNIDLYIRRRTDPHCPDLDMLPAEFFVRPVKQCWRMLKNNLAVYIRRRA